MRNKILAACLLACSGLSWGQADIQTISSDLNKSGGVYFAYPAEKADNTSAPKGYKPFHISHYGRHGSRYLISDNDYTRVERLLKQAHEAKALTPLGEEVRARLDSVMTETQGRGGDLSPLGRRQHRGIAKRMIENYPEVFTDNSSITARSTLVPRCIISMTSFCESLKEENPKLWIDFESSNRYMPYLCHSIAESDEFNGDKGWWKEVYRKFEERHTNPDRLVSQIFSNPDFVDKYVNPHEFMWNMYWLASDAQNTEKKINFYDIFTPQELFDLWRCFNASFYARHSSYPAAEGKHVLNAANLLNNIIDTADEAIASDTPSAALRFGHDGNIVPLTALMGIENCDTEIMDPEKFHEGWCDFYVAPMAANVQLIFFRNEKNPEDIIVKVLHNEKERHLGIASDIYPYYHWNDVKRYFKLRMGAEK